MKVVNHTLSKIRREASHDSASSTMVLPSNVPRFLSRQSSLNEENVKAFIEKSKTKSSEGGPSEVRREDLTLAEEAKKVDAIKMTPKDEALLLFMVRGGFVYFDNQGNMVGVNAVIPHMQVY